jgi:hypothetical protein
MPKVSVSGYVFPTTITSPDLWSFNSLPNGPIQLHQEDKHHPILPRPRKTPFRQFEDHHRHFSSSKPGLSCCKAKYPASSQDTITVQTVMIFISISRRKLDRSKEESEEKTERCKRRMRQRTLSPTSGISKGEVQ